MKLGIVRKIDNLGRVVIPAEVRRVLEMNIQDTVEIYAEDDRVVLKKYSPECVFCGITADVKLYKGKNICPNCMEGIVDAVDKH